MVRYTSKLQSQYGKTGTGENLNTFYNVRCFKPILDVSVSTMTISFYLFLCLLFMKVSIYPVTGCARRNPYLPRQWQPIKIVLSMPCCQCFVFWRSFTELNSLHHVRTLEMNRWVMLREKKLVQCKYIPDTWQLLSFATFTKYMKAGLLPNICEFTTTRIIITLFIIHHHPIEYFYMYTEVQYRKYVPLSPCSNMSGNTWDTRDTIDPLDLRGLISVKL